MTTDPLDLLLSIPPIEKGYAFSADCYRDFHQVFLASPDGQRVLRQLLDWTRMFSVVKPAMGIDPNLVVYHEGERHIGTQILAALTIEPQDRPSEANRTRGKDK